MNELTDDVEDQGGESLKTQKYQFILAVRRRKNKSPFIPFGFV